MPTLDQFISNVRQLQNAFEPEGVLSAISEDVLQVNRARIVTGKTVSGADIEYRYPRVSPLNSTGSYTRQYSNYKSRAGGQTSFVDLKLDGTWLNSLRAEAKNSTLEVTSEDSPGKTRKLLGAYPDVIGVASADVQILAPRIQEESIPLITDLLLR